MQHAYLVRFTLGRHDKATIMIGTSVEDIRFRLPFRYFFAAKPPVFVSAETLNSYYYLPTDPNFGRAYEEECNRLRGALTLAALVCASPDQQNVSQAVLEPNSTGLNTGVIAA